LDATKTLLKKKRSSMLAESTMPQPTIQAIEHTINRLMDVAKTEAIFGKPVERNGVTIIPCSEIAVGLGMGGGRGVRPTTDEQKREAGKEMGGGGGGGARGRPIAVVVVTRDKVSVQPIPNVTRIAVSLFTTLGFIVLGLVQLQRARRTGGRASRFSPLFARKAIRQGSLGKMRRRAGLIRSASAG
jgi:uncharacterized spore protein YtfJ